MSAHSGMISTAWEIGRLRIPNASCPRLDMQRSGRLLQKRKLLYGRTPVPDTEYSHSWALFLPELHRMNYTYTGTN